MTVKCFYKISSYRLEALLVGALNKSEKGALVWEDVQECVGVVLDVASPLPPSHTTNVLKLITNQPPDDLQVTTVFLSSANANSIRKCGLEKSEACKRTHI